MDFLCRVNKTVAVIGNVQYCAFSCAVFHVSQIRKLADDASIPCFRPGLPWFTERLATSLNKQPVIGVVGLTDRRGRRNVMVE